MATQDPGAGASLQEGRKCGRSSREQGVSAPESSGNNRNFESTSGRSLHFRSIVVEDWQGVFIGRHDERGRIKEFKTHSASALCAPGESVTAENNHFMRQAMLRMGNPIHTGLNRNIARFECLDKLHFASARVAGFSPVGCSASHFGCMEN